MSNLNHFLNKELRYAVKRQQQVTIRPLQGRLMTKNGKLTTRSQGSLEPTENTEEK